MTPLTTTIDKLDELYRACEHRTKYVEVPRQALLNLLMDHAIVLKAAEDAGVKLNATP